MKIIREMISVKELKEIASAGFGDMVKAVVDVSRELLAIDAELHADLEALMLENGSDQKDLWGINLYPDLPAESFLEYDSMINIRPSQGNRSRSVDSETVRKKIAEIIAKRVAP